VTEPQARGALQRSKCARQHVPLTACMNCRSTVVKFAARTVCMTTPPAETTSRNAASSPPLQSPSSWVTSCRVDGGVVIQTSTPANLPVRPAIHCTLLSGHVCRAAFEPATHRALRLPSLFQAAPDRPTSSQSHIVRFSPRRSSSCERGNFYPPRTSPRSSLLRLKS